MDKKPIIYDYLDYRKYLKDFYDYMKATNKEFSYRRFASDAHLTSENYLKMVIDGKVHLTTNYRNKFAEGCGMSKEEKEYFFQLIDFNKAKRIKEKNRNLIKLGKTSGENLLKELEGPEYKLLTKWYYMVVRALVTLEDFNPDPEFMAKKLRGLITPIQAKEALDVLLELGIIKNENGKYILSHKHITTKDEIANTVNRLFHSQMIPQGVRSLEKNSLDEREIRAMTIGISKKKAIEAKERIKEFYKELREYMVATDENEKPQEIWQLNMQLFKLTRKI